MSWSEGTHGRRRIGTPSLWRVRSAGTGGGKQAAGSAETSSVGEGPSAHDEPVTGGRRRILFALEQVARYVPGSSRVHRRIKEGTPLWVSPVPVSQPRDRGSPTSDPEAVLARYRASPVTRERDDFVLYRIIGNDLPPRHQVGQARRNLAFILEHEPHLPGCEKRFVVNRIADNEEERQIVALLEQAGAAYFRIPFSWEEYAQAPLDVHGVPERYLPGSKRHGWLRHDQQERVQARLYRHKNNYVMNNNGARNAALDEGRAAAKWVMPWDGNCFLTEHAYAEIREAVRRRPDIPYVLVRMVRLDENLQAFAGDLASQAVAEPQIVFRRDASMGFDWLFPYGRRPKVELLWRLGVPGPWDEWGIEPWDLAPPSYHPEAGAFEWAGWVARLAAGPGSNGAGVETATDRSVLRTRAILAFLKGLDHRAEGVGQVDVEGMTL